jgi:hypothetical protein
MSVRDQPGPRHHPLAVWTGGELIVLGGVVDSSRDSTKNGGRYQLSTDSWTPTSTNNAPPYVGFRVGGAWTGRELLLFGGHVGSAPTEDSMFAYRPPSLYEHDELPDDWQQQHFGEENPIGLPEEDADHDGQNNLFEYVVGTNPAGNASRFNFTIASEGQSMRLSFGPRLPDRTYVVEAADKFYLDRFKPLADGTLSDDGDRRIVEVNLSNQPLRFFRVRIDKP